MKKKEKIAILILIIIGVISIAGLVIWKNISFNEKEQQKPTTVAEKYVDVLEDGTKINKSNKLKETKNVEGLEISNIQLTYKNGMAVILGDVKNAAGEDRDLTVIEITLFDDNNNEISTFEGIVSPVKSGETVKLNIGASADYANAYDFKVVVKK